ncbi:MAG: hypothetical protein JWO03_397 [Bacteroidetes bacterium]|nr:hypothetical protein [Bacteroidota bacterium]
MRYLQLVLIALLFLTSCRKSDYRSNPIRSVILGRYHYNYSGYIGIPQTCDIVVSIPSSDDGNSIYIGNCGGGGANWHTYDSSFSQKGTDNPMSPVPHGYYRHDSLIIYSDQSFTPPGYSSPLFVLEGIGVKF